MGSKGKSARSLGVLTGLLAAAGVALLILANPGGGTAAEVADNNVANSAGDNAADNEETMPQPEHRPVPTQAFEWDGDLPPELKLPERDSPGTFVSPEVADSAFAVLNHSVFDVVQGAFQAMERADRAWLARVMESRAGRETLNEDDLHAAHRRFLWRSASGLWGRARAAWDEQAWEIIEEGDHAELVLEVGGALGTLRIRFTRVGDRWYFAEM